MKARVVKHVEFSLYPETTDKFYRLDVEMIHSTGFRVTEEVSLSREPSGLFHWVKAGEVIEAVDAKANGALSDIVMRYCQEKIG